MNNVENIKVVITGASSGIGEATAILLAKQGAEVILIARRTEKLNSIVKKIRDEGGLAHSYTADLANFTSVDSVADEIIKNHDSVDVLINNAGHSIRRPFTESLARFHDFERCITLNYYSPLRLTRKLLPGMLTRNSGHIINSTTWGTLFPVTGFGPYNASKAALESSTECLRAELRDQGIVVTQIHFPLVHTAMSGATQKFKKIPGLSPEEASEWVLQAIIKRPARILDAKTTIGKWFYFVFPGLAESFAKRLPFSI